MSIKSLSCLWAEKITDITRQKELVPKIAYGLEMVISETTKIICLLLVAALLDLFLPTLFLLLSIIPLRVISGGGHCTSSLRCLFTTIITYLSMAAVSVLLAKNIPLVFLLGFCLLSYCLFAAIVDRFGPGPSVNYPEPSKELIEKIKRRVFAVLTIYTLLILNIFYLAQNEISLIILASAAIGGLWQSLMITTYGQSLIAIIDKSLLFAKIK